MGNKVEIDSKYWGSASFQEQDIKLGNILSTLYIHDYNERVPIGIAKPDHLNKLLPEFAINIKPGKLIDIQRSSYNAPDSYCCIYNIRHWWTNDNNNSLLPDFDNSLITCHPGTIKVGESSICDEVLYDHCLLKKRTDILGKCEVWLDGVLKRYDSISIGMVYRIHAYMKAQCNYDVNNHVYCKHWLSSIRNSGNPDFELIGDLIISNQLNKENFKCAFPPEHILNENNILDPYECWYRECALSENWKLLTKNIAMKNSCSLTDCNISIGSLNITPDININAICNAAIIKRNSLEQATILKEDAKFNEFPMVSNIFIFLLCLLFIIYIFLYINNKNNNI